MREVDFLPDWYSRMRRRRRWIVPSMLSLAAIIASSALLATVLVRRTGTAAPPLLPAQHAAPIAPRVAPVAAVVQGTSYRAADNVAPPGVASGAMRVIQAKSPLKSSDQFTVRMGRPGSTTRPAIEKHLAGRSTPEATNARLKDARVAPTGAKTNVAEVK